MPIVLDCPGCGKRYEVESALAGKKSRCKQCGEVFRIPDDAAGAASAPSDPGTGQRSNASTAAPSAPRGSASSWESILAESGPPSADSGKRPTRSRRPEAAKPQVETIVVHCPGCDKRYELSSDLAGKKSRCRQCGEVFVIGGARTPAGEAETGTMTSRPQEPPTARAGAQPELYWEVVLNDDSEGAQGQKETKLPDYDKIDGPPPARAQARAKKRRKGASDTSLGITVTGWFSVIVFLLFASAYGAGALGLLSKAQVNAFIALSLLLTLIACFVLNIWGFTWVTVIAFRESEWCGIKILVLPGYALYYMLTRKAETHGAATMVAVSVFAYIGLVVVGPLLDPEAFRLNRSRLAAQPAAAAPGALAQTPADAMPASSPQPGRRAEMLDRWAKSLDAIATRYGNKAVILVFTGIPTNSDPAQGVTERDVWDAITRRIKELAPAIEAELAFGADNHKAYIVAPIDNPAALAQSIDFGKVTLQQETRIRVDVSPEFVASVPRLPPPSVPAFVSREPRPRPREPEIAIPPDADPVTKSLLQLKSSDKGQQRDAVRRLERTTPDKRLDEVVAALLPLLNDDDGFLVNDAIKALMVWQSPKVLPALIERSRDNRFFVRKEAVKALGKFKDARAVEAIIPHFKEDRFEAEAALKEIGPVAEPALIQCLRDPDPHVRRTACDILKQIGGADTLRAMRALPPDPDLGVRMAAKAAAEQIVARVGFLPRSSGSGNAGTKRRP